MIKAARAHELIDEHAQMRKEALRRALPDCPLLVGSGVSIDNLGQFLPEADGFIVGTALKEAGDVAAPVSAARVAAFTSRLAAARGSNS